MFDRVPSKGVMPTPEQALPGREQSIPTATSHFVNGAALKPPFASNFKQAVFGMGCFWGAERKFWALNGVAVTAVGYVAGYTSNPTYEEVCSGRTGHNEAVLVVYNPDEILLDELLVIFWESHSPVEGMRQGNDTGTQYRSGIYLDNKEDADIARQSLTQYQIRLNKAAIGSITTEILTQTSFYYAETYHQQYLAKNPQGYCGLGGTGVTYLE